MDPLLLASQEAARAWGVPAGEVRAARVTEHYPWCKRFDVVFVTGPEAQKALVASDGQGTVLRFADERGVPRDVNRAARLAALNDLLAAETATLPNDLTPVLLAKAVRAFLSDPSGFVASQAFLEEQIASKAIDGWTRVARHLPGGDRHTQPERREMFTRACTDPDLDKKGGGAWSLAFNYFSRNGGVERWHVEGDARRITSAADETALPANTFNPPLG
jgi:hypothetical protein